jgi:hypothetical protein
MIWVYFLRGERFHITRTILSEAYPGQSEVENLGMATLCNEDIRWFDVSMDDPFRVSGIQPI